MFLLALRNETLMRMCWWNKCYSVRKSYGGSPGSTGVPDRARRHASIDEKLRKSLVYTPPTQRIIPNGRKLQRSRILETSHVRRKQVEDIDVL